MRVAVLWATLTGYMNAALKTLAAEPRTALFVADNVGPTRQAPFAEHLFSWIAPPDRFRHDGNPDAAELIRRLEEFAPDVLFVASWSTPAYNEACRHFRGRAVRVTGMDNQCRGTAKQYLGVLTAPFFVRRLFDCVMVGGERQRLFAERLGFDRDHIWERFVCPDYDAFSAVRLGPDTPRPHTFLCAARLVEYKGIALLAEAYAKYRTLVADPWPLHVAGSGELEPLIRAVEGVEFHGFVQPDAMPALFRTSGCFILPSLVEPWGVVLQEAAVAGLPMICSQECGATVHYLVDGYNGYVVKTGSAASLTRAMVQISTTDPEQLAGMSQASMALGDQMTPTRWARYVLAKAASFRAE